MQVLTLKRNVFSSVSNRCGAIIRQLICITAISCLLQFSVHAQTPGNKHSAIIKIDPERSISEIDPKIYGVFMEPIHLNGARVGLPDSVDFNTLYGTLYDPSSPLADANGFRKDLHHHQLPTRHLRPRSAHRSTRLNGDAAGRQYPSHHS